MLEPDQRFVKPSDTCLWESATRDVSTATVETMVVRSSTNWRGAGDGDLSVAYQSYDRSKALHQLNGGLVPMAVWEGA